MTFSERVYEHREISPRAMLEEETSPDGKKKRNFAKIGAMAVLIGGIIVWKHTRGDSKKPKDPRFAAGQAAQRRLEVFSFISALGHE